MGEEYGSLHLHLLVVKTEKVFEYCYWKSSLHPFLYLIKFIKISLSISHQKDSALIDMAKMSEKKWVVKAVSHLLLDVNLIQNILVWQKILLKFLGPLPSALTS